MIRRRYIILILLILGITAALEAMPKEIVLYMDTPEWASSPLNQGPPGTSVFLGLLRKAGYEVVVLATFDDLRYLDRDKVALVIISPEKITEGQAYSLMKLAGRFDDLILIVADEYPYSGSQYLVESFSSRYCGITLNLDAPRDEPYYPTAYAIVGTAPGPAGESYLLTTGYVAIVRSNLNPDPLQTMASEISKRMLPPIRLALDTPRGTVDLVLLGAVSPYLGFQKAEWHPLAVYCTSSISNHRKGVLVIGDGSIFTNEALVSSQGYVNATLDLINYVTGGPDSGYTLVFFTGPYAVGERSVAVRFHPSILFTSAIKAYRSIEDQIAGTPLTSSLFLLMMLLSSMIIPSLLLPGTLKPSRARIREGIPRRKEVTVIGVEVSAPKRIKSEQVILSVCEYMDMALTRRYGVRLLELAYNPAIHRAINAPPESMALASELVNICNVLAGDKGVFTRILLRLGYSRLLLNKAISTAETLASQLGVKLD